MSASNRRKIPLEIALRAPSDAEVIAERAPDCHPFRVAAQVVLDGGGYTEYIIALLHDSLEDGYATRAELDQTFGILVCDAVRALTRHHGEPYADYIDRIARSSPLVRAVKRADLYVNLGRCMRDERTSLVRRYQRAWNQLSAVESAA